jgi:hypothetical protein
MYRSIAARRSYQLDLVADDSDWLGFGGMYYNAGPPQTADEIPRNKLDAFRAIAQAVAM